MKKSKANKNTVSPGVTGKQPAAGYAGQDFEQGRGGHQSGHDINRKNFNQFQNTGNAGYASEHRVLLTENNKQGKR